jgi:hypothetical protein
MHWIGYWLSCRAGLHVCDTDDSCPYHFHPYIILLVETGVRLSVTRFKFMLLGCSLVLITTLTTWSMRSAPFWGITLCPLQMFWHSISIPSSRVSKSKKRRKLATNQPTNQPTNQTMKELTKGRDLHEAQVDICWSFSHSCVLTHRCNE